LFTQPQGARSEDAIVVHLQRAAMEARTYEKGSVPLARSISQSRRPTSPKSPARARTWQFGWPRPAG
jgi:hypothetical protein